MKRLVASDSRRLQELFATGFADPVSPLILSHS